MQKKQGVSGLPPTPIVKARLLAPTGYEERAVHNFAALIQRGLASVLAALRAKVRRKILPRHIGLRL